MRTHTLARALAAALAASATLPALPALAQPKPARKPGPATPAPKVRGPAPGWWRSAVFYTVDLRAFADATTGGGSADGLGDLAGLVERLDYLRDAAPDADQGLGVTAIRLLAPLDAGDTGGLLNFYATKTLLGTNEDLRALVEACHARGLRVVFDLPVDRVDAKHQWVADAAKPDSPMRSWFVATPGSTPTPAIDYATDQAAGVIAEALRFWASDFELDGFGLLGLGSLEGSAPLSPGRRAAAAGLLRAPLAGPRPGTFFYAPDADAATTAAGFVAPAPAADSAAARDLPDAILDSITSRDASPLASTLETYAKMLPSVPSLVQLSPPEGPRAATTLKGDPASLRLAAALSFVLPAVPMILAGDELGLAGQTQAESRAPFPWDDSPGAGFTKGTPFAPPHTGPTNAAAAIADPTSLLNFYKRLIRLRATTPALVEGTLIPITCDHAALLAFLRVAPRQAPALVVANLGDQPLTEYALTLGPSPLRGTPDLADALSNEQGLAPVFAPDGSLQDYRPVATLGARRAYVFVLSTK